MLKFLIYSILIFLSQLSSSSNASQSCKKVRFSDIGWTDTTATTALASVVLNTLGFETKAIQLSVPVTFVSLKNKDIDVFLGNWMPSMAADIKPYQQDGSVETIGALLKGARYSVAVPKYVSDAGVKSIDDLNRFKDKFRKRIYGIEPGNDGNRIIHKMISDNAFGLGNWKLIESGEQAMLMEVLQAIKQKKWIAFLGWEPHPMNQKLEMSYLGGIEAYFGSKEGESTVYITSRKNYSKECPNIALFLKNFSLTIQDENTLMSYILDLGMEPKVAARRWIQENFKKVEPWLKGVTSQNGREALAVVEKEFSPGITIGER